MLYLYCRRKYIEGNKTIVWIINYYKKNNMDKLKIQTTNVVDENYKILNRVEQ